MTTCDTPSSESRAFWSWNFSAPPERRGPFIGLDRLVVTESLPVHKLTARRIAWVPAFDVCTGLWFPTAGSWFIGADRQYPLPDDLLLHYVDGNRRSETSLVITALPAAVSFLCSPGLVRFTHEQSKSLFWNNFLLTLGSSPHPKKHNQWHSWMHLSPEAVNRGTVSSKATFVERYRPPRRSIVHKLQQMNSVFAPFASEKLDPLHLVFRLFNNQTACSFEVWAHHLCDTDRSRINLISPWNFQTILRYHENNRLFTWLSEQYAHTEAVHTQWWDV